MRVRFRVRVRVRVRVRSLQMARLVEVVGELVEGQLGLGVALAPGQG